VIASLLQRLAARLTGSHRPPEPPAAVPDWGYAHPPGHYYSPLPDLAAVRRDEARIFPFPPPSELPGIDLAVEAQLGLLEAFREHLKTFAAPEEKVEGRRYFYANAFFAHNDAQVFHCILRHFRPRRVIEVGSGFSTAFLLDARDDFLGAVPVTAIEPYPERLHELLRPEDLASPSFTLHTARVQDVDVGLFDSLESGDVLFIDSSHVSKAGSDVNHLFFNVLPRLAPGVLVHVHDMLYPFEYFKEVIYAGVAWNEAYLLRAFLMFNSAFEILFSPSMLQQLHYDAYYSAFTLWRQDYGSSFWMRRRPAD
jgi:predicted O-methyltransferase YrrM